MITHVSVTPETGPDTWRFVDFFVATLAAGEGMVHSSADREVAIVVISGVGTVRVGGQIFSLSRTSVFTEPPHVLYVPPGNSIEIEAGDDEFTFSLGGAPAEGRYPIRLFTPDDLRVELRGGGTAHRQVGHVLSHPLPAERLILYEVHVPRGTWAAWPPHCHDGFDGSPYLEEVYYFKLDRPEGFSLQRNWREDEDYDEQWVIKDGTMILVPKGYHVTVACPAANMYFLNYLAGELQDDARKTPPCFHSAYTWIDGNWSQGEWTLPLEPWKDLI